MQHLSAPLPTDKEQLEAFFADGFVTAFNSQEILGEGIRITSHAQMGTEDLDYRIVCPKADYLELAETTPLSEPWGRTALQSGVIDVYQMGGWIWQAIIKKKSERYGEVSRKTFLLLYSTHPSLLAGQSVIDLLRSTMQHKGCHFAGVFYVSMLGGDTPYVETIAPWSKRMPTPRHFKGLRMQNLTAQKAVASSHGAEWSINLRP